MADYRLTQSGDEVQRILDNATPQSELTAETERATGAEHQLQNNINTVQQNLNGEAIAREQDDNALRQFIQQVQGSLINYYLKTETYSANQIDQMLAAIKQFRYQVVDVLPTPSAETMGIIYLVPSAHAVSGNIKDEYITLTRDEGSGVIYYFEQIGETAIDLSNYYTKAQTNAEISAAINTAIANYYTKQEVDALIANFITRTVSDLTNYYLKSETYTQAEIQQLIAAIKQFRYQSVTELPTASADTMGIIYLVPSTNPQQQNVKDEFITISATDQGTTTYSWEQIGSTEIDLSGYYTSAQTDAAIASALASYSTTEQMSAAIVQALLSYYTKQQVDSLIADFITKSVDDLVNYYLKSDTYTKAEVQQMIAAVQQFTYVSVAELPTASADTMNKIYLVPSTNPQTKNVKDEFITIAVTDQGTTTYSWEQIGSTEIDLSGYYTSQQTDAAINTALSAYSTTTQMNAAIAAAIANFYTKQEVDALIANFITPSTQNLVYYYLKSDTFTKAEVNQLIDAVKQFQYQSVQTLPTASAQTMNIIYLVPGLSPTSQNVKDEYITIATTNEMQETVYAWEKIGTTEIDLSNYYTKAQTDAAITAAINTALADYSTTSQMTAAIAAALASYYTKSEVDALIANFITASTQNLAYYYLKSETYSATEVNQLIAAVKQFQYQSVAELPTASAQTMNIIYLVPGQSPTSQNVKDEYITIATTNEMQETVYAWEKIGTTQVDLSNYYTKSQTDSAITTALNTALADYSTTSQVSVLISTAVAAALGNFYNKSQVDALIADFITKSVNDLTYYYLKSETYTQSEVQQLIAAVKQFRYQTAATLPTASADTMGIIYLVPSTNPQQQNVKDEFITVESTNDQDETVYAWEQIGSTTVDLSGYYTSSQTDNAISAALTAALADYSTTTQMGDAITLALSSYYTKTEVDNLLSSAGGHPYYATCSTAGGTAAKVVSITGFTLKEGAEVSILFTNGFTATSPTLNINDGGAKAIKMQGMALSPWMVGKNNIVTMLYNGTDWDVINIQDRTQGSDSDDFVDLGLPSGTKWAKANLGGTNPQDLGQYFSWGNITGHAKDSGYDFSQNTYNGTTGAGLMGGLSTSSSYDAARNIKGYPWRIPTYDDFLELLSYCRAQWTTVSGQAGMRFTSNINGNSIFLPAAGSYNGTTLQNLGTIGNYWAATLNSATNAYYLNFNSTIVYMYSNARYIGLPVRAVQ